MANPYDVAKDLVQALRETDEYQKILTIQTEIEKDAKLNQLLNTYRSVQVEVQTLQLQGEQPDQEVEEKIRQMTDVIQDIPLLKEYLDAEEQFGVIFQSVQQTIMEPVVELFEDVQDEDN